MFVAVLNRSLIRNLLTTPGVYRKLAVRTTKRTLYGSSCDREMPSLAERSLGNKQDDQLSHCTLTDNGHKVKLNELSHFTLIDNGHKHKLHELSHCTLTDNGHKVKLHVNELSHCTEWPMSQMTHCGHPISIALTYCTLLHCGYKLSEPTQCTPWPNKTRLLNALCSTQGHDQALTNRYLKGKSMHPNELPGQTNLINCNNITYDKDQWYCAQISLNTDKGNIEAVRRPVEKRNRRKRDR